MSDPKQKNATEQISQGAVNESRRDTETFSTGCVRQDSDGKGAYELFSPYVLERDAKLFEWGARNRGHRNWEKGCPFGRCVQSIFRHLTKYMMREPDEDMDDNLAAIRFWAGALMHYEEMIKRGLLPSDLDDLPKYKLSQAGTPSPSALTPLHILSPLHIYVAGPISDPSPCQVTTNIKAAIQMGDKLRALGHLVFVPHKYRPDSHTTEGYKDFLKLDLSLIEKWADAMFVLGPSPGTNREIALAVELGLPIFTDLSEVPVILESSKKE